MITLFKISVTGVIQSLLPILSWYVLAFVCGNPEYINGFTYSYAFQFIFMVVYSGIVKGNIQHNKLTVKDKNSLYSSVLASFTVMSFMLVICIYYKNDFMELMKLTNESFVITVFGVWSIICDLVVTGLSLIKQYDEEYRNAFKTSVIYYSFRIVIILLVGLLVKDIESTVLYTSVLMLIYIIIAFCNNAKSIRFTIDVFRGLKYQASSVVSCTVMFIVYLFGISSIAHHSESLMVAYSVFVLCKDMQCDVLRSAIDTYVSINVCNNDYDSKYKQLMKNCIMFSIVLFMSSVVMILASRLFKEFDMSIVFQLLLIECSLFQLNAIKYCKTSYLQLKHPCLELVLISSSTWFIRMITLALVDHKYNMSIGVFITILVTFVSTQWLYSSKRKCLPEVS